MKKNETNRRPASPRRGTEKTADRNASDRNSAYRGAANRNVGSRNAADRDVVERNAADSNVAESDLIYGRNPVLEALRKGRPITRLWLIEDGRETVLSEIVARSRQAGIPYKFVDKQFLDRLTDHALHQGMVAQAGAKAYVPWEKMLETAREKEQQPLLILLDEVEDPYNLGAVLRSADALGAHGVIIPKHRAVPLTAGVGRSSAGAVEYVPVDRVTNLSQTIEQLKKAGLWIMGATAEAKQNIYETDWTVPVALVLGGENKGLSRLVQTKCDLLVSIPMQGHVNSLNVSASAAIVLSEISRQRRIGKA